MQLNSKNPKQRRYIRYAIELKAVLDIGELGQFACVILDFCSHGLFLKTTPRNLEVSLPKNNKIRFKIGVQTYELAAQVMHNSPNGIGVLIDNMPLAAFNALKTQIIRDTNTLANADGVDKPMDGNVKLFLKQALLEPLAQLMANFFETLSDNVLKANAHSDYFASRSELDDFVTALKLNIDTWTSEFCHSVVEQIDWITEDNPKKEDITHFDRPLSLVEKEDFEDWLNMSAVIRKLANHFEEQINQVTRELSRIFGRSKTTINNPVSPAVLCDCCREIILQFKLDNKNNKVLYICFGKALFGSLPDFYRQVNSILIAQASAKNRGSGKNIKHTKLSNINNDQAGFHDAHEVAVFQSNYDEDIHQHQKSITTIAGKLLDILKEVDFSKVDSSESALQDDVEHAFPRSADVFDKNEIANAIKQLQTEPVSKDIHQNYEVLQDRLQELLNNLSDKPKVFSRNDSKRLDVYGKFFETLFKDSALTSELKPYLENIHLPLMALPLQDIDFLESDSHPVNNILNRLSVLGQALKGNKTARINSIKDFLNKITTRIAQEIHGNPDVLIDVEKELDVFTKNITKTIDSRIKHVIDIHEGQQRLALARLAIQSEIDKRIAGRTIPTAIPMLLDAGWRDLLVFAELNKAKQSDRKTIYLNVIDDLMFWLYEQDSVLKIQTSSIQTTITFIEDQLSSTGTTAVERRQVVEELTALLLGTGNPKVRKSLQTIKIAKPKTDDIAVSEQPNDSLQLLIDQLVVGDWLRIRQDLDWFEPMKLVWIGNTPVIYVFVNTEGLKSLQFNKNELVELFRQGLAEPSENLDIPLTERTTNAMLQDMHEQFVFNATHDPDTNLMTRDEFIKQLKNEIQKLNDAQHILCHIDVLDFRVITNICGLSGSKQMLKTVAQRITDRLRASDLFARLGDKSFAILFKNCSTDEGCDLSKQLIKFVAETHFKWQEKSLPITLSMGLVPFSNNCIDIYQLLQQADTASLSAERSGHGNVLVFAGDDENIQNQHKLLEWIGQIDTVFSQDRLFARCQMIAPIEPDKSDHMHYEILLGIKDEAGNIIPPDHFIPAVERGKRMHEIDKWVITTVFDWIENNRQSFDNMDGFSINLSGQSLNSEEFLQFLQQLLGTCLFPLEKLVFEITETVASENLVFTKNFIKVIKEFGCRFSLDDFGSGYSSYSYLKNLDVDFLKIDGAFVKELATNKADLAIVKSMNEIAHSLNLKTIAEYVESAEIQNILKQVGVDYGQGYFIHKPMPLTELIVHPKPEPESELFYFEDNSFWEV